MEFLDFERCPKCQNTPKFVRTCDHCHHTGFVKGGRPASDFLGEPPSYQRKLNAQEKKIEEEKLKLQRMRDKGFKY